MTQEELLDKITTYIDTIVDKSAEHIGILVVIAKDTPTGIDFKHRTNMTTFLPYYHAQALGMKVRFREDSEEQEAEEAPKESIQ